MKAKTDFIQDGDRYLFDLQRCQSADGWAPFDTDEDAWCYGHWINPLTLELVGYAKGDVIHWQAESPEEFTAQARRWIETMPGGRIDHMCRPKIVAALIAPELCELAKIEALSAPDH